MCMCNRLYYYISTRNVVLARLTSVWSSRFLFYFLRISEVLNLNPIFMLRPKCSTCLLFCLVCRHLLSVSIYIWERFRRVLVALVLKFCPPTLFGHLFNILLTVLWFFANLSNIPFPLSTASSKCITAAGARAAAARAACAHAACLALLRAAHYRHPAARRETRLRLHSSTPGCVPAGFTAGDKLNVFIITICAQ